MVQLKLSSNAKKLKLIGTSPLKNPNNHFDGGQNFSLRR